MKAIRYWGTRGRYVKRNQLLGFIDQIGHDADSIPESLLEHAIEEDDDSTEPDMSGIAVVTDEAIRRVRENKDYEEEEDDDDDDSEDEDPVML
jgi:hypothetical protein